MTGQLNPSDPGDKTRETESDVFLGRLAVDRGLLGPEDLRALVQEQEQRRAAGETILLGDLLIERRILTAETMTDLLREKVRPGAGLPQFSRYQIGERLREGATAVVYRARDQALDRALAVKVLKESAGFSDLARQRFRREAQAAAALSHPNLVTVFDVGEEGGTLFIAMELVEGRPLVDLMRERAMPLDRIVSILEKVARGVAEAHRKGIVHRDLKPANILVGLSGEPKVGDFGLAHLVDSTTELTRSGAVLGTPIYMAPEQVESRSKEITPRTDVYALGAILYEAATGGPPHTGETVVELYSKIVREDPLPPRRRNPSLPPDLERIILKSLDKEPSRRYPTAESLAEDLGRYLRGEPVEARSATPAYRIYRRVRRSPVAFGLGFAILALLAVLAVIAFSGAEKGRRLEAEEASALRSLREKARIAMDAALDCRRAGRNDLMQRYLPALESAYREAIARAPAAAEADYLMGRAERMLMNDAKALEHQESALRKDPEFAPALYERIILASKSYGEGWLGSKSRDEAEQADPKLVPVRERLMRDLATLLRLIESPRKNGEAASLGLSDVAAARGILAFYQSKYLEAQEILEKAVAQDPLLEEAWETLALAVRFQAWRVPLADQEKHYRRAEEYYTQALAHDRGYLPHLAGRGFTLLHLADLPNVRREDAAEFLARAEKDYREAIRLDPRSARWRFEMGYLYSVRASIRLNRKEDPVADYFSAEGEFRSAVEIDPSFARAWLQRGRNLFRRADQLRRRGADPLPDYAEAERCYGKSLELRPDDRGFYWRGQLRSDRSSLASSRGATQLQDLEMAETDYTESLKMDPRNLSVLMGRGVLWCHLAEVREKAKDLERARRGYAAGLDDFREALRRDPSFDERLRDLIADAERKLAAVK